MEQRHRKPPVLPPEGFHCTPRDPASSDAAATANRRVAKQIEGAAFHSSKIAQRAQTIVLEHQADPEKDWSALVRALVLYLERRRRPSSLQDATTWKAYIHDAAGRLHCFADEAMERNAAQAGAAEIQETINPFFLPSLQLTTLMCTALAFMPELPRATPLQIPASKSSLPALLSTATLIAHKVAQAY